MKDVGQILQEKTDLIVNNWIETVRQDGEIASAKELAYQGVRDSVPLILGAIATLLTESKTDDDPQTAIEMALEHGVLRANQGYDASEIVREYRLLREVIFSTLEPDLLSGSATEVLRTVRVISTVLDEVISFCLESYIKERLRELEQVKGQLILTNQELSRLVQSQKVNFSYLAHELKNPLNAIMGYSELLLQRQKQPNAKDASTNLQLIERLTRNGQQLLRLINDTLEISRYEAGQIELNLKPTNVTSIIEETIEALEPSARIKDLKITVNCDRAPEKVLSDPLRLQQIVTNLLSNAIRYTDRGTIQITCQVCDHHWQLAVADTGRGISPENQTQIFQPFFRIGSAENYYAGSTGLGLAIVAQLVELLQGEIELVSQVAQGSTFTVTFPLTNRS